MDIMDIDQISPNFVYVSLVDDYIRFWVSYKTIIAFQVGDKRSVCENVWSVTTGRYLAKIEPDKAKRMARCDFFRRLNSLSRL